MPSTEPTSTPEKVERKGKKRFQSTSPHGPTGNGAGSRKKKKAELAEELVSELGRLRGTLDEVVDHYRLRVGGDIAALLQAIQGSGETQALSPKVTGTMLAELRETRLKPDKGRAKDLVRLQRLVRRLSDSLPAED